jgi:2-polyprenyl-3-methyl-5-hydroxy-6-metoxy-1,4-benzoquinol methylase
MCSSCAANLTHQPFDTFMPARKNPKPTSKMPLDVAAFWRAHDSALTQHSEDGDATLSHDLYRGMPAWFNAYYDHFQHRAVRSLLKNEKFQAGMRGLDLGCGTGRWSGMMSGYGVQAFGFDLGMQALCYARGRWPQAHFTCARLPHLCFAQEQFDLAISVTVLQHVPRQQQLAALRAVWRALKPGGLLLACETTDARNPSAHIFGNSSERWLELFQEAGYQLVGQGGCEYLPHVRLFQWLRQAWQRSRPSAHASADVSAIAGLLQRNPWLALPVWLAITLSYPLEYLASTFLPPRWANLGCFALRKI